MFSLKKWTILNKRTIKSDKILSALEAKNCKFVYTKKFGCALIAVGVINVFIAPHPEMRSNARPRKLKQWHEGKLYKCH